MSIVLQCTCLALGGDGRLNSFCKAFATTIFLFLKNSFSCFGMSDSKRTSITECMLREEEVGQSQGGRAEPPHACPHVLLNVYLLCSAKDRVHKRAGAHYQLLACRSNSTLSCYWRGTQITPVFCRPLKSHSQTPSLTHAFWAFSSSGMESKSYF